MTKISEGGLGQWPRRTLPKIFYSQNARSLYQRNATPYISFDCKQPQPKVLRISKELTAGPQHEEALLQLLQPNCKALLSELEVGYGIKE